MFLGGTTETKVPPVLGGTILTWPPGTKAEPGGTQQACHTIKQSVPLHVWEEGTIALADGCRPTQELAVEWGCRS